MHMKMLRIFFWVLISIICVAGIISLFFTSRSADAATNISATTTLHMAWNDVLGWIDLYTTDSVTINASSLSGYASSSIGMVSFDCATSPNGNICATSNYGICNGISSHNTDGTCSVTGTSGSGELTGYAWSDMIGWISFSCDQSSAGGSDTCGTVDYGVTIDGNGDFSGFAWNDMIGWISFNCASHSACGSSDYKVHSDTYSVQRLTGYVESSVFDTGRANGALLNSIIWQGAQPSGTSVDFQIATSSSPTGPWVFVGPAGDQSSYYGSPCPSAGVAFPGAGPNKAICVDKTIGDARYLRYKARLQSDFAQSASPRVDDVVLNWSE